MKKLTIGFVLTLWAVTAYSFEVGKGRDAAGRKQFGNCEKDGKCPPGYECLSPGNSRHYKGKAPVKKCVPVKVGSSCLVDCGSPSAPDNGEVSTPSGTAFGQTATFSCNNGYALDGNASVTCLQTGDWSGNATCTIIDCGSPVAPDNGEVSTPSGTTFGQNATFSCDSGYVLDGDASVTCLGTGNWSGDVTCTIIDCGSPTPLENGKVHTSGTTFGQIAKFKCNYGYMISGQKRVRCLETGKWSGESECITDCGSPVAPDNGEVSTPSGTTFGQNATFSCDSGYVLDGDASVTCLGTGNWSGDVTCTIIDCGNPVAPDNGKASTPSGTTFGQNATFSCVSGYAFNGSESVTCLETGAWSDTDATCTIIDCGNPVAPDNGKASTPSGTTFGQNATFSCVSGYAFNGSESVTCLETGAWSDTDATCTIIDCGNPVAPDNGKASTPSGTTFGQNATFSCVSGYAFDGSESVTCLETGAWSDTDATCTIIDCGNATAPENGAVHTASGTTFGRIAKFSCNYGYMISGQKWVRCLETGKWSGEGECITALSCDGHCWKYKGGRSCQCDNECSSADDCCYDFYDVCVI